MERIQSKILDLIGKPGVEPPGQQTVATSEEVFDDVPLGASWGILLGELGEAQDSAFGIW